jgi:hypothetical protein
MMTIVVVGIIAVPLSLLLYSHVDSVFHAQDLSMANNLARFEMETVGNLNYSNIANASFTNYQGYPFNVNRTFSYVNGNATSNESTKKIIVVVSKANTSAALVNLTTYLSKNILYPY